MWATGELYLTGTQGEKQTKHVLLGPVSSCHIGHNLNCFSHPLLIPHREDLDVLISRKFRQSQEDQFNWYISCHWCELHWWGKHAPIWYSKNTKRNSEELHCCEWKWVCLYCCSEAPLGAGGQSQPSQRHMILLLPSIWNTIFYLKSRGRSLKLTHGRSLLLCRADRQVLQAPCRIGWELSLAFTALVLLSLC